MDKQKQPAIISSHVSYNNVPQVSYNFSKNIAQNSEYFNLHLLEACQNSNQHTMLLVIWLQIVTRLQRVNNNCIAFFFNDIPYFEPTFRPLIIVVYVSNFDSIFHIQLIQKRHQTKIPYFLLKVGFYCLCLIYIATFKQKCG